MSAAAVDDDDDMGAMWAARKAHSQIKRKMNRDEAVKRLTEAKIPFTSPQQDNAHLIVRERIDFWPGTGLWRDRVLPREGRGIKNLLRYLGTPQ